MNKPLFICFILLLYHFPQAQTACSGYLQTHSGVKPNEGGMAKYAVRQRMGDVSYRFCHIACQRSRGISNCRAFSWGKPGFIGECYLYSEIDESQILTGGVHKLYQCTGPGGVTQPTQATVPQTQPTAPPTQPPTTPPTQPTTPPTQPTVPPTQPTVPPTQPTVPPTQPTVPPTQPTVPPTQPTVPPTQPTVPPTQPTVPPTQPTVPPTQPATQPTAPPTQPTVAPTVSSTQHHTEPPPTTPAPTQATEPMTQATEPTPPPTQATTAPPPETTTDVHNADNTVPPGETDNSVCGRLGIKPSAELEVFSETDACVVLHKGPLVRINVAAQSCNDAPNGHMVVNVTHQRAQTWRQNNAFPSLKTAHIAMIQISKQNEPAGDWFYVQPDGTYWAADTSTAWQQGSPDNQDSKEDCAAFMSDYTVWDIPCNIDAGFICQYPSNVPKVECKYVWSYKNVLQNAPSMATEAYHLNHLPIMDVQVCANYCAKNYGLTMGVCDTFTYGTSKKLTENQCWLYHGVNVNALQAGHENLYMRECQELPTLPPQTTAETTEAAQDGAVDGGESDTTTTESTTQPTSPTTPPTTSATTQPPTNPTTQPTTQPMASATTPATTPSTVHTTLPATQPPTAATTAQPPQTTPAPTQSTNAAPSQGCSYSLTIPNTDPRPADATPQFDIIFNSQDCQESCVSYSGPFDCKAYTSMGPGKHCYVYGEIELVKTVSASQYHLYERSCDGQIPAHTVCRWQKVVDRINPRAIDAAATKTFSFMSEENCQKLCHYKMNMNCNLYAHKVTDQANGMGECEMLQVDNFDATTLFAGTGNYDLFTEICS